MFVEKRSFHSGTRNGLWNPNCIYKETVKGKECMWLEGDDVYQSRNSNYWKMMRCYMGFSSLVNLSQQFTTKTMIFFFGRYDLTRDSETERNLSNEEHWKYSPCEWLLFRGHHSIVGWGRPRIKDREGVLFWASYSEARLRRWGALIFIRSWIISLWWNHENVNDNNTVSFTW